MISTTVYNPELQHQRDINESDLYPHLSDIFSQGQTSSLTYGSHHHKNIDDFPHTAVKNPLQNNLPIINDQDFFLLPMKDLESISIWNKWRLLNSVGYTGGVSIAKQLKKFYINSVKLIDGFKFIIKIPDKFITAPTK